MAQQTEKKKFEQQFCVHVGTYEGTILGFVGNLQHLESKYAYTISPGSIKAILTATRFLFVSGYDEIIRIYDTKKFKEVGNLDGHTGSILTMKSHKNILLSSGDDGNILTWKFKEWALIHRLKAHTATIYDICIHPSGKILVSISKDNRMFVWNLINGQKVYQKRFSYNLSKVIMLEDDKYICLLSDYNVHIIDAGTNKEIGQLKNEKRINDFITYKHYLIVGDEKGYISIWDPNFQKLEENNESENQQQNQEGEVQEDEENPQIIDHSKRIKYKAHSNRVKQMRIANIDGIDFLISVSSSGEIKIWDCLEGLLNQSEVPNITENQDLENVVKPVYQIYTNQRITAMDITVYNEQEEEQQENNKQIEKVMKEIEKQKDEQKELEKLDQQKKKQEKNSNDNGQPKSILKKSKKIQKGDNSNEQQEEQKPLSRKDKKKLRQKKMQEKKQQKKQKQQ